MFQTERGKICQWDGVALKGLQFLYVHQRCFQVCVSVRVTAKSARQRIHTRTGIELESFRLPFSPGLDAVLLVLCVGEE